MFNLNKKNYNVGPNMFIFCCNTFRYTIFLTFLGLHTILGPYNIYIFYNQYSSGSFCIPYIFHIVVFSECPYVWVSILLFFFWRHVASSLGSWGFGCVLLLVLPQPATFLLLIRIRQTIENFAPDHPTFLNSFILGDSILFMFLLLIFFP